LKGPLPDDEDNGDEGGMPQIVKELAPRYPRTNSSILLQIFEDKFGKFGTRKSPKDLGSVKRWFNTFIQYLSIISDFKKHDIVSALLDFHSQILKLDESYQLTRI